MECIYTCNKCLREFKDTKIFLKHRYKLKEQYIVKHLTKDIDFTLKPILKWVGGKTQILNKIIGRFPIEINNYHELFLGGGSVLFGLLSCIKQNLIKVNGSINCYDINETLINLYKNIQVKPQELYNTIEQYIKEYNTINGTIVNRKASTLEEGLTSQESYYYYIRTSYNKLKQDEKNSILGSALFIFLNKTCFRGVYRVGPNGFNVPFGNYSNPNIISIEHLMNIHSMIKNVKFIHSDFSKSIDNIQTGDFVYLDPPYAPESSTSFVGYNIGGFDIANHNELFKQCNIFNDKNIKFIMSNSDVELVKKNFPLDKFTIKTILCKRSINSKNPGAKTNEIIIYKN